MEFKEKLEQQLSDLYLEPKKHTKNQNHLYADYIELIALFSNNSFVTSIDVINRFKVENISPVHPVGSGKLSTEIGSINSEINDEEEQWANEIFGILDFRADKYSKQYPFEINQKKIILKKDLTNKQKMYLILLLSSNLNYFSLLQFYLTTEFESISFYALRTIMPRTGIIKEFGENSDYKGNAIEKISALATDLNIEIDQKEVETIQGNKERGLDLIAWIPFEDKIPNMLTILGQCACGKDWYKKQHETRRFESAYFRFYRLKPIHTLFIPYSLSNSSNTFYQSDEINDGTLIFDRKRILDNIDNTDFLEWLNSKKIIEKCINFEEDIV